MHQTPRRRGPLLVAAVTVALAAAGWSVESASMAIAAQPGASVSALSGTGYDIGYPQCNGAFPQTPSFGIAGVNGGRVYSANPCLGSADGPSELAWAYAAANGNPAFYANTANPGPKVSTHWPSGQASPRPCATNYPKNDSTDCAYDYGWNAAQDSYADAVAAEEQVYGTSAHSPALRSWWLDVETTNSWETLEYGKKAAYQRNDAASVQGAVDFLTNIKHVSGVGVYSTSYQWNQITGGAFLGSVVPNWVAGAADAAQASTFCSSSYSFSGGPVQLTQYPGGGFDADHPC